MTLYISINRTIIANNKKNHRHDPPFEIRRSRQDAHPVTAMTVHYPNPKSVRLVYDPATPLVSGAVAWLEVDTENDS